MKTNRSSNTFLSLGASLAFAVLSSTTSAATLSTSATVASTSGSGNFTLIDVLGLNQFDSANGTLTGISFSLEVDAYDVDMSLGSWDDSSGEGFGSAGLFGQISVDVNLPGGGGFLFSSTSFGDDIFDEFDTINVIGSSNGVVTQDATTQLTDGGVFGDFIGPGQVSILQLGIFAFGNPELVTLGNGDFAEGDPNIHSFTFGPSEITIEYTYTPAVVPVPAAAWLFGSALLGLAGVSRKRRK